MRKISSVSRKLVFVLYLHKNLVYRPSISNSRLTTIYHRHPRFLRPSGHLRNAFRWIIIYWNDDDQSPVLRSAQAMAGHPIRPDWYRVSDAVWISTYTHTHGPRDRRGLADLAFQTLENRCDRSQYAMCVTRTDTWHYRRVVNPKKCRKRGGKTTGNPPQPKAPFLCVCPSNIIDM